MYTELGSLGTIEAVFWFRKPNKFRKFNYEIASCLAMTDTKASRHCESGTIEAIF